ncbi:MAG: glycoside hydrolase family 3 C-terminal domain-containing protein [Kiritimatiellae bacterium]|nr:glycoside hydrolase family 3 C-terminal domain-containing protein [Kiritimatiellia bacterium]
MKKTDSGRPAAPKRRPLYKDPAAPVEARVRDLLSRMTLEEKAEQLCQDTIGKDPNPDNHGVPRGFNPRVGSIYQFMGGAKLRNRYQRAAVERTRLGIPILWAIDVIHGWRTTFPVSLAQAASFDPSLTEKAQRVAARECKADGGIDWLLGPMVEVGHDPRWGRNVEGYGEDPYTNGRFAAAAVRGMQAGGVTAACPKHFVGYSACEGGRDYSYTEISARALREWYLPPFAAAAKAGALTVMSSFNEYDGKPVPANRALLTDELRGRMGFKGFVVSDSGALSRMGNLGYARDPVEQTAQAIRAGNDMCMGDGLYRRVPAAVAAGKLSMEEVDRAVARVLRVKFAIGLFDRPYVPERPTAETCRLPDALALALRFARETMVLLKNEPPRVARHSSPGAAHRAEPVLPLDPKKIRRIALVGPAADEVHPHLGQWRAAAEDLAKGVNGETFLDAARRFFPKAEIRVARGCAFWDYTPPTARDAELRAEAVEAARGADAVLLCFGEVPWMAGEKKSRRDISLPPAQAQLAGELAALGVPLVGLCCSGRALAFPELAAKMDALLWCWQSGCRAPTAAMEILVGKTNPGGKLPVTLPRCLGQVPIYYNHHPKITPECPDYQDFPGENGPWFPFGFGLSYTTFKYGKVKVESRKSKTGQRTSDLRPSTFNASVTVCNAGTRAGKETVIWYLSDPEASYTQPVRRVIAFEKISLKPGETKTVRLRIDPMRDLAYDLPDGRRVLEPGDFVLSASLRSEARFAL